MMTRRSVLAGAAACLVPLHDLLAATVDVTGTWTGVLAVGSRRLRMRLEIAAGGQAVLYSLDQDNKPNSGKVRNTDSGRLQIRFKSLRGTYTGALVGTDRMEGIWEQGFDIPFTLLRGEQGLAAANPTIAALDQPALESLRREAGAPALAAAASARGASDQIWVAGSRSTGHSAAVTSGDQWHMGSLTKSMTATLVARLVEAGAITWDTRVGDLLATTVPGMHETYRAASFRHLLSHRAGMPENIPVAQFSSFIPGDAREIRGQRMRYAQLALKMKPVGPRESTYQYSNNGYVVAAAMLEAALREPWEALMQTHLFQPLGLQGAGFGPPEAGSIGELQQPIGHVADLQSRLLCMFGARGIRGVRPGAGQTADNPRVLGPAGRVRMTLADLLIYLQAHRDGSTLLQQKGWQTLHTPPFGGDYAMGWIVRSDGSLWHNGSNNRWYAEALFNRETGIAAAATCNESRPKAAAVTGTTLLRAESAAMRTQASPPE